MNFKIAVFLTLSTFPALASTFTMNVTDFLVDGRGLVGQLVTITGCKFGQADTDNIMCSAGSPGLVRVDTELFPRDDRARAIRDCGGFAARTPASCSGAVTGLVVRDFAGLRITKATIGWRPSE